MIPCGDGRRQQLVVDFPLQSIRFVLDQCHNHAVQVVEEHEQVESKLDKRLLLRVSHNSRRPFILTDLFMNVQLPENLSRVEQMLILKDPVPCQRMLLVSLIRLSLLAIPSQ